MVVVVDVVVVDVVVVVVVEVVDVVVVVGTTCAASTTFHWWTVAALAATDSLIAHVTADVDLFAGNLADREFVPTVHGTVSLNPAIVGDEVHAQVAAFLTVAENVSVPPFALMFRVTTVVAASATPIGTSRPVARTAPTRYLPGARMHQVSAHSRTSGQDDDRTQPQWGSRRSAWVTASGTSLITFGRGPQLARAPLSRTSCELRRRHPPARRVGLAIVRSNRRSV